MAPNQENLRCFLRAAKCLNFRAAAREAALSPAAFGQRIRQLEDELGAELFRRTTRRVTLTEAGLCLVPFAERAQAALEDCGRALRGDAGAVARELVLGTRHELGLSWLVPMLPRLEASRPGLALHLYVGSGEDLALRVRGGSLDCAVTSTRLTDPKLDCLKLHAERYVLVGCPRLTSQRPLRSAADARGHTLIDIAPDLPLFRYWRDAPGAFDSLEFERVVGMGTIAAIRQRVLRGDGVAVLPEYFVARDLAAKRLLRLLPQATARADWFRLIFRADDPRRSLFEGLARVMLSVPLR